MIIYTACDWGGVGDARSQQFKRQVASGDEETAAARAANVQVLSESYRWTVSLIGNTEIRMTMTIRRQC